MASLNIGTDVFSGDVGAGFRVACELSISTLANDKWRLEEIQNKMEHQKQSALLIITKWYSTLLVQWSW